MKWLWSHIVGGFFYLSSLLPMSVHYVLSDLLYPILFYIMGYRRGVVRRNIANAFPEKTAEEQRDIVRGFYHFFCDYIAETCKLLTMSEKQMRRRMTFEGVEEVEKALEDHDFVFIYLGHYCNWEWISSMPLWFKPGQHCGQLYRPLNNEAFDKVFMRLRTRFGAENIPKNDSLRRIVTLKREGTKSIIGFISDQRPRRINIHDWVTFLNQDTPVFTGTERIAKKVKAAIFFADVHREHRGHYHCHLRPLTMDANAYPDYELTETYMRELEKIIRRQPEFYLWSHKRWKFKREE